MGEWKQKPVDEVERAASFIYVVRSAFGAKPGGGWAYGKTSKPRTVVDLDFLSEVQKRLSAVYIDGQSYSKVIAAFDSPDTLFYLDPPYWIPGEKFYRHEFNKEHHEALRDLLSTIEGKFVLSYNDSRVIRKLYRGFRVRSTGPIHYSGNNKRTSARMKTELIIRNF